MASPHLYSSKFGDVRVFASQIQTDQSRRQVIHELSDGDDHVVQDVGTRPISARVSLLFDYMLGDSLAPLERLRAFEAQVDDKPRMFTHPTKGSFLARVSDFSSVIDSAGPITGDCLITQVGEAVPVSPASASGIPVAGVGAVDAAAAALATELEELGIESTVADDAIAAVNRWSEADVLNPREVLAETGSLTSELDELAADLDSDAATWQAYKATIMLADALREAAEAATADTAQTFTIRPGAAIALRALVAMTYGADEADIRYAQVMSLNDLPNPAWLEPGIELVMPQIAPKPRSA